MPYSHSNRILFHSKPLVVTSSNMPNEAKAKLRHILSELGGVVVGDWQESCSHLTMAEILLTAKVVCALASGIPIVTPEYWEKFKEAIDGGKAPPSYEGFIPPLKESILNRNKVSFAINEKRKTLFSGKTFVFSSEKQLKKYKTIVMTAGGDCESLAFTKKRVEDLSSFDMVVMQHVSNSDSQPPPLYDAVLKVMRGKGLKPIPESEIGLAILMCSLETYCNMQYNVVGSVLEGGVMMSQVKRAEVLAEDSQMSVIDSVSIKTEEPDVITYKETIASTPPVPIRESSSLSSNGSFKQWQNHQETLPCSFGKSNSMDKNSVDGNSSPSSAPGPSRKRPPSIEIGEPPPKRCPTDVAPKGVNEVLGPNKDVGRSKDLPNQEKISSTSNDRRGIENSSTSKRKLQETDNGFMNDPPLKKSLKEKHGSSFLPEIEEDPVALAGDFAALMADDDIGERRASNGGFSNGAREPLILSGIMKTAPSTSRGSNSLVVEEEEKNWEKDAEQGVRAIVDAGWGNGLKGKMGRKLVDEGHGMCVKYSKLLIRDRPTQNEVETSHDSSVVNFKRFRKGRPPVTSAALPFIIGESDLVRR
ncbi:nibrin isoform X2 [Ischnura elegans]|uniref:nibrin isoform X2 n=1 Tax=Ischnura elegans TaxID=197161 RepID=UPI001ED8764D|nr:nibrin isoform X2 [Ischnura elegans]